MPKNGTYITVLPCGSSKKCLFIEGKKHGVEVIIDEFGKKVVEQVYSYGSLTEERREYYRSGQIACEVECLDEDVRREREWDESGNLICEVVSFGDTYEEIIY